MAVTINGSGVVTGVTTLPDGIVTNDDLAGSIAVSKLATTGTGSSSTFLSGTGAWASAGGGKILQIQETRKVDTFTTSANLTDTDITGLSVNITPSATSSSVLVFGQLNSGTTTGDGVFRLYRDSTSLGQGTDGSGTPLSGITGFGQHRSTYELATASFVYLDSAISTTSQVTYKLSLYKAGTVAFYLNRTVTEGTQPERVSSSISVMEIGA